MDIVFLSKDMSIECEQRFIKIRSIFSGIKRIHGNIDDQRVLSISASMSDSQYFATIDGDKDISFDISYLLTISKSIDGSDIILPSSISIFDISQLLRPEELSQSLTSLNLEIVYLTYEAHTADQNFIQLKKRYPRIMRLHGVKGMTRAFALSAQLVKSKWYILIDEDNTLLPNVDLNSLTPPYDDECGDIAKAVVVHGARNAVNDLEYCYGGIKICPTLWFRSITYDVIDPIASGGSKVIFLPSKVLSITNFNCDPYSAWKAGFRESVMLSTSSKIDFTKADEWTWVNDCLETWKTIGSNRPFGSYCMEGACQGHEFAQRQMDNISVDKNDVEAKDEKIKRLAVINDPDWLRTRFANQYPSIKVFH